MAPSVTGRLAEGRLFTDRLLPQETIVNQLEQRYINGIIYTYIGDILVAINPFVDLGIYSDKVGLSRDFASAASPLLTVGLTSGGEPVPQQGALRQPAARLRRGRLGLSRHVAPAAGAVHHHQRRVRRRKDGHRQPVAQAARHSGQGQLHSIIK